MQPKSNQKKIVSLVRSETWLEDNFLMINSCLESTIEEFVGVNDRIINIEMKEHCGLKRFWIYVERTFSLPIKAKKK